jgi:hypothetical protein
MGRLQEMGETAWPLVIPAIREYVRHIRGGERHKAESRVQRKFTPGDGTSPAVDHVRKLSLDQLRELCDQSILLPTNRERKAAQNVTLVEWSEYVAKLQSVADDLAGKIHLYKSVMHTLRSLKANTIAEALTPDRKKGK